MVDAGDFIDIQTKDDSEWSDGYREIGIIDEVRGIAVENFAEPNEGTAPIVKNMFDDKYDAIILGNHEFYSGLEVFKSLIDTFNNNGVPLLSANTYYDKKMIGENEHKRISKPYIIKNFSTKDGDIKIGIIGGTTNTINEEKSFEGKDLNPKDDILLQNSSEYKGKFYMTDLVDEIESVAKELKEKENPDMILLVVHSGEKPKKPRHSGNRIQELAKRVPGVDMIIAGHTHVFIDKHEYDGVGGKKVVVSQPGRHSEGIGNARVRFYKKDGKWKIKEIDLKIEKFAPDETDNEDTSYSEDIEKKRMGRDEFYKLKKDKDIKIKIVLMVKDKLNIPDKTDDYIVDNIYDLKDGKTKSDGEYVLYYMTFNDYDKALDMYKKYDIYSGK